METLGQFLKRVREERHITREDISKGTKYHLSQIQAIEEDRHEDLPAIPYVKGMLRSISKHLELDQGELADKYSELLKEKNEEEEALFGESTENVPPIKLPFYKKKKFLLVSTSATFVVLIFIVAILFRGSETLEPIGDLTEQLIDPGTPEVTEDLTAVPVFRHQLSLTPTQKSWFKIQVDSEAPYAQNILAGTTVKIQGKKALRFFVSDAKDLKISYNGKVFSHSKTGAYTFIFPSKK